jgi:hypothetical protein
MHKISQTENVKCFFSGRSSPVAFTSRLQIPNLNATALTAQYYHLPEFQ